MDDEYWSFFKHVFRCLYLGIYKCKSGQEDNSEHIYKKKSDQELSGLVIVDNREKV